MRRTISLASSCLLALATSMIAVSVCAINAEGKQVSGTLSINKGDFYGWQVDVMIPSQIDIEITGHNGSVFDVLILDDANYSRYVAGSEFDFYGDYSALSVSNATLNISVISGSVYIIVDNSNRPSVPGAATPSGEAKIAYWIGSTFDLHVLPHQSNLWLMYVFVGVGGIGLVFVVFYARKAIKEARESGGKD